MIRAALALKAADRDRDFRRRRIAVSELTEALIYFVNGDIWGPFGIAVDKEGKKRLAEEVVRRVLPRYRFHLSRAQLNED